MYLKQLRYFIAVAEELHFGRAAARLFISQPALSFDIKKLEEQMGIQLLVRNNKSVKLTSAGQTLLDEARHLLVHVEQIKRLTARSAQGVVSQLRIGFVSSILHGGLPEAAKIFQQQNPEIEVAMFEMNSNEQPNALQRNQIDIGFVHWGKIAEGISTERVMTDTFVCCLPENHPLARQQRINLADLQAEGFILFPREVSPHYHDLIVAKCVSAGFSPIIHHEARLWQTIVTMVSLGLGVALVPKILSRTTGKGVYYVEVQQNFFSSETHAIYLAGSPSQTALAFLGILKTVLPGLQ